MSLTMFSRTTYMTGMVRQCGCRNLLRKFKADPTPQITQAPSASSYPVLTGERGVNQVTLIGRVGRDPEIRGDEQNPVTIFPLATSQTFRQEDGSYNQFTEWHRIVVFRRALGQMLASSLKKGDKAYVSGSIHYNKISDRETNKPTTITQIRADDVMQLSKSAANATLPEADDQPID